MSSLSAIARSNTEVRPLGAPSGERFVAVIWQRFGPYHLARLRGASAALAGHGWRVIGIEIAGRDHYDWAPAIEPTLRRSTLFPDRHYSTLQPRAIGRHVARVLAELKPEAVCVNGWAVPEAVAALRWSRRAGARTILMSETFESAFNPLKQALRRWRVTRCDAAIVGGGRQADYLRSLGFGDKPVELGYDVVDNAHFAGRAEPPAWVGPIAAKRYFFANTRLLKRKGIDALLRAYARYRSIAEANGASARAWHLVISGSGKCERSLKALAAELGVGAWVIWPGFLQYEELPAAYQHAGAFVHPARREAWGLVINEAAAAGLPLLVGHRVGAAHELVRDGQNGFLVEPDDVEGCARLLYRTAMLPDDERAAMGKLSEQIVSAFGPDRFGQAVKTCVIAGI